MRQPLILTAGAVGLVLLGLVIFTAPAQERAGEGDAPSGARQTVGLLDVSYIYKHCPQFTELISEMKADVQRAEEEVKKKKETVQGMQQQLQLLGVGTPEYTELEKRITMAKAELTGSLETQKKEFLRREARLYHEVYQDIVREVEDHAKANHIAMVLRFNDDPVNVAEPKDVLRQINRRVVWHDKKRDLTRIILQRLVQKSKQSEQNPEEAAAESSPP